jgi:hypothetical protein
LIDLLDFCVCLLLDLVLDNIMNEKKKSETSSKKQALKMKQYYSAAQEPNANFNCTETKPKKAYRNS